MFKQRVQKGSKVYCPYCWDSYDTDEDSWSLGKINVRCATCGREFEVELVQETPNKESISVDQAVYRLRKIYENHPEGIPSDSADRVKVREIGQALYDAGGMIYMLAAHQEFARSYLFRRHARNLEIIWNGIGEWMG